MISNKFVNRGGSCHAILKVNMLSKFWCKQAVSSSSKFTVERLSLLHNYTRAITIEPG